MSIIGLVMNVLLAGLLFAALGMGWRLNRRLKALRDSHDGFAVAVRELNAAAARAEQGLADLRAATDEAHDALADRIEKARALTAKLDRHIQSSPQTAPRARREEPVEDDVERVTHRLGALLSGARDPRPERTPPPRREPPPVRPKANFDDDLFDQPAERQTPRAGTRR
jgi:hypothetical protein